MTTTPFRDANTGLSRAFVDELVRAGVTDACVAPGSRSTPLVLALANDERIRVHVHLDERSAAFLALGTARMSGRPAAVLTTSGTAASNLHPAVLEAHHGRVPLLVLTADRPPELRDAGAGQTVDQQGLFGNAVRWMSDPGPPEDRADSNAHWRSIAGRAVAHALGPPAGPVHINLPFREPLVPTGAELVPAPGRSDGLPWVQLVPPQRRPDEATVERVAAAVRATPRGVLLAGWGANVTPPTAARFAAAAGWPILADPISGLRTGDHAVSTYDALLRIEDVAASRRPDLAVRIGAPHTSKAAMRWLGPDVAHQDVRHQDVRHQDVRHQDVRHQDVRHQDVRQWMLDPDGAWLDPQRAAEASFACDSEPLLAAVANLIGPAPSSSDWLDGWMDAEARARRAIDDLLDGWADPFEGRVARDLVAGLPDGANLAVASSMPVRDVESFAAPRDGLRVLANRGVNGIDGFTSTVLGAAAMADGPTVALLGDLCFLHDTNGLLGAANRGIDATLVVVDNDGGGIFSFLPQADDSEHFEALFGTPHGIDLAAVAAVHGVPCVSVEKANALLPAVEDAIGSGGVRIVLVRTDRAENVARHREAWAAVGQAVS